MPQRFVGNSEPGCECGAGSDSAHFTRAWIYRVGERRAAELACAFDGYLCANCGRVWTKAGPEYYGKLAAPVAEHIEECDGGRDPWMLH